MLIELAPIEMPKLSRSVIAYEKRQHRFYKGKLAAATCKKLAGTMAARQTLSFARLIYLEKKGSTLRDIKRTLSDPEFLADHDYKAEYLHERTKREFESNVGWLYVSADATDPTFAKLGITTGDLRSRSYSSGNPDYHIFCAFKCRDPITRSDLERIEKDVLSRLDTLYTNDDGSSRRIPHYESNELSECYRPVDFITFLKDVHRLLYVHHYTDFQVATFINDYGIEDGSIVRCIFNDRLNSLRSQYARMFVQYD